MTYDSDTFRRRAASFTNDSSEDVEIAGHLALAYAALERRRRADVTDDADNQGDKPILLQE